MYVVIDPTNRNDYKKELNDYFHIRKRVFVDALGWRLPTINDMEIEHYDTKEDPVYILSVDDSNGAVRGGVRLMPTTGPHLMKDVFSSWFANPIVLESATIWEATRFCVDPAYLRGPYTPRGLNLATSELICGAWDLGAEIGLTQLTAICHLGMVNALKRAKCPFEIIDETEAPAGGRVFLGLWDVSHEIAAAIRQSTGLDAPERAKHRLLAA